MDNFSVITVICPIITKPSQAWEKDVNPNFLLSAFLHPGLFWESVYILLCNFSRVFEFWRYFWHDSPVEIQRTTARKIFLSSYIWNHVLQIECFWEVHWTRSRKFLYMDFSLPYMVNINHGSNSLVSFDDLEKMSAREKLKIHNVQQKEQIFL